MVEIKFTIPDNKVQRIIDTMKWEFSIPIDAGGNPLFTDGQWAKESIRRWIINQVARYEKNLAEIQARNSVLPDDSLLT